MPESTACGRIIKESKQMVGVICWQPLVQSAHADMGVVQREGI